MEITGNREKLPEAARSEGGKFDSKKNRKKRSSRITPRNQKTKENRVDNAFPFRKAKPTQRILSLE